MRKVLAVLLVFVVVATVIPAMAMASIGVGVGTGKIAIKEPVKSGSIYTLPTVIVFNTGTETATYTMSVTFNQNQPQLKPSASWFSFSPNQFTLAPQKSQIVTPKLHPPIRAQSGDYFAYLEAHPAKTVKQGKAVIGVAAATKLSFSLKSSNIFISVAYRIIALYQSLAPWSYILSIIIILALLIVIFRRFLHIKIRVTRDIDKSSD